MWGRAFRDHCVLGWSRKASWTRGLEWGPKEFISDRKEGGLIEKLEHHLQATYVTYKQYVNHTMEIKS